MSHENSARDAYRLLFPTGCIAGLAGAFLWLLFAHNHLSWYPREAHGHIMFFAFFWAFVSGFLMTAIPRMTGTETPSRPVQYLFVGLVAAQTALNLFSFSEWAAHLFLIQLVFLLTFLVRRFLVRRRVPFEGFVFLPFAFLAALGGGLLKVFGLIDVSTFFLITGEMFLINLILGIGSRLIPVLSRLPDAITPDIFSGKLRYGPFLFVALILNLSYLIEIYGHADLGITLRIAIILFHAITRLGFLKRPLTATVVGIGLKAGMFMILLAHLLKFSFVGAGLAGQHILYIGGFALITLMIGVRVMVAHSGHDLVYEIRGRRIAGTALFLVFAALLRWLGGVNPISPLTIVAVFLFIAAVLLWLHKFFRLHQSK